MLATHKLHQLLLEKFFPYRNADQSAESLDELFLAAACDGFFTTPPTDKDIYHTCRGLLQHVSNCHLLRALPLTPTM